MSAKGFFANVTSSKTTLATGQGLIRHINARVESSNWGGWSGSGGIKIWIDGESTESTSISCEDLFGLTDLGFTGNDASMNNIFSQHDASQLCSGTLPGKFAGMNNVDGTSNYVWIGSAEVRIPFDSSLEASKSGLTSLIFEINLF